MALRNPFEIQAQIGVDTSAMANFILRLMHIRTNTHMMHLATRAYSVHKALDEFYTALVPLIDKLAEAYQGRYGLLAGYSEPFQVRLMDPPSVYLQGEMGSLNVMRELDGFPQDGYLINILDEIAELFNSTLYKLNNLG